MITHLIVGAKGSGKTTFVKNTISKVNRNSLLIYDPQREYTEFTGPNYKHPTIEKFCNVVEKVRGAVCVFEESTIFFDTRSNNKIMKNILVSTRHHKNTIIMVFHSVRSIPQNIFELCDYITLFRTLDNPDLSSRQLKDERIGELMKEVQREYENKNWYFNKTLKIR